MQQFWLNSGSGGWPSGFFLRGISPHPAPDDLNEIPRNDLTRQFGIDFPSWRFCVFSLTSFLKSCEKFHKSFLEPKGGRGVALGRKVYMSITLEQAIDKYRDFELKLNERWFSGKEWNNGTAEREIREEYRHAILKKDPSLEIADDDVQLTFSYFEKEN